MELLGVRQPFTHFQEEKYQMLELNQRLESYLGRVKLLEEENKLLKEEIYTLKKSAEPPGQRKAQEEALLKTRKMKEEAWREKDRVEMEVENLIEDIQMVNIQRQKEKTAQAEAQKRLADSKKELEEERRAQIWLREKFAQLEKDLVLQMQVHQENMETLQASLKQTKQVLMAPQINQTNIIPDLGQEYDHRAAQAWKEATSKYQRKVENLEESLNQSKTNMGKIHQEKREKQYQIQQLAKELESTKMKREMLEKHAVQQRDEYSEELQHLQAQVDALEVEKESMGQEIGSLMVDRQNLLQVKMSLGLELATYRALLESEGTRIKKPATNKTKSTILLDALSKPIGTHPASKTSAASSQFSSIVSTSQRSISSSHKLLTNVTPTWTPTRGSPQKKPTSISVTDKKRVDLSEEKGAQESVKNFHPKKDLQDMACTATPPQTRADSVTAKLEDLELEKESEPKDVQMVESKTNESVLMSVLSTDHTSSPSQTPETESWAAPFTEPAGVSEESKDEDTEVSVEMARISHAPKVAWEENKTIADDKEDASEMDVRSETVSDINGYRDVESDNTVTFSHVSKNTNIMVSSMQEHASLYTVDGFGYKEETNEDLMRGDEHDNVSNISEDVSEPMNSETEAAIDSIIEWDREENNEEPNRTSPDFEVEEQNEMKVISSDFKDEEQDEIKLMSSDFEFEEQDEIKVTSPGFEVEKQNEIKLMSPDFEVEEQSEIKVMSPDFKEQNEIKLTSPDFEVEEQNEMKVMSPDFEVEEQNEIKFMSPDFEVEEQSEIKVMSSDFEVEEQNEIKVISSDFEVEEQNEIKVTSPGFEVEKQNEIKLMSPEFEVEEQSEIKVISSDFEVEEQNEIKLTSPDFEVEEQNEMKVMSSDFEVEEQNEIKFMSPEFEVEEQSEIKVISSDFEVEEQNKIQAMSPDSGVKKQNETKVMSSDFEVEEQNEIKVMSTDFEVKEQNEMKIMNPDFEEQNEMKMMNPDSEVEEQNEMKMRSPDSEVEEHNTMKVMSPDIEAEEQGEVGIDDEIKDKIVTTENKDLVIKKDVDEGLQTVQTVDSQKNLDHVGSIMTEVVIEETVAPTEEYKGEEENQDDDDDSQNISVSCRTDPGECDSYTQENTIADTRPLIRYKSDDETDINVQAAHFGGGETSDSEDEKERIDGGRCGESVSKRFNTMEDLSEEPDMDVIGEMITEETVQTEKALDNDRESIILQSGHDGSEDHEDLMVEGESEKADLMGNQKVESDDDMRDEDYGLNVCEQKEIPQLNEEPLIHHTEQPFQEEYETIKNDSQENDLKFVNNPTFPDPQFPETAQEVQLQDSYEVSSALFQSTTITEQTFQEDIQNISMHTNIDFTETLSLESERNSQPDNNMPNFDQDECNSSDDESPNASQSFQYSSLSPKATANEQPLTLGTQLSNDEVSKCDFVSNNETEVFSKDFIEKSTEDHTTSQIHDCNNSNICKSTATTAEITFSMDESSSQHSMKNETENFDSPNRMPSVAENIFGVFEKNTTERFSTQKSKVIDTFQRDIPEEDFPSKESEIHSFFSTNLKEEFWNEGKMEMGATNDPVKTETFTHESIHLNQGMVFGEEWTDLGVMPTAIGNPKEEMKIFKVQTQDEKLRHKDEESRQVEMIQSDESVDGGDSWSSGDE